VKKVRITLCIPKIWHFFTGEGFEVLQSLRDTKKREVKVTVEKRPNRAGGPHFLAAKPPKSFPGSLPPSTQLASACFPRCRVGTERVSCTLS